MSEKSIDGGFHVPTARAILAHMERTKAEGERMGLKVGTLREAIEDVERAIQLVELTRPNTEASC